MGGHPPHWVIVDHQTAILHVLVNPDIPVYIRRFAGGKPFRHFPILCPDVHFLLLPAASATRRPYKEIFICKFSVIMRVAAPRTHCACIATIAHSPVITGRTSAKPIFLRLNNLAPVASLGFRSDESCDLLPFLAVTSVERSDSMRNIMKDGVPDLCHRVKSGQRLRQVDRAPSAVARAKGAVPISPPF